MKMIPESNSNQYIDSDPHDFGFAKSKVLQNVYEDEKKMMDNETRFRDYLKSFAYEDGENPIDIIVNELRQAELRPVFDGRLESQIVLFLIMDELNILVEKKPEDFETNIKNIIQMIRRDNVKVFFNRITMRLRALKKITDDFKFVIPKGSFVLQKAGKSMKGVVLRDCFLTQDTFGQIKDKKSGQMQKPNLYRDQFIQVQTKRDVIELMKTGGGSFKSDKAKPFLSWPDKKELSQFTCRVLFQEINRIGRQRAVYMYNISEASFVRNNAIFRRIISNDANIKLKLLPLKAIRMVKLAEFFYTKHLQRFLKLENLQAKIKQENDLIRQFAKEYAKLYYPPLETEVEVPPPEPYQMYNFHDNSHMIFKKTTDQIEAIIDLDETKRQMATMIQPDFLLNQTIEDIPYKNKNNVTYSPFEKLDVQTEIDQEFVDKVIKTCQISKRNPNSNNPALDKFIQLIADNSKFLLRFKKIVLPNFLRYKDQLLDETEYEELIFGVDTRVAQDNQFSASNSFLNEIGNSYISYEIRNSLKITYQSLYDIKFKLTDRLTGVVLFDGSLNLEKFIDNVYLENPFFYEIMINYKGNYLPAIIYCTVAFIPKSLETSHITLNKELIDLNFNNFIDILRKSETYPEFRQAFYSKAYVEAKNNKFNYDLFFNLNNYLSMSNVILNQQENMFANSFVSENIMTVQGILRKIFFSKASINDICNGHALKFSSGQKLGGNLSFDLLVKVCDLINVKERYFIHKMLFELGNNKFFGPVQKMEQWQYQNSAIKTVSRAIDEGVAAMGFLQPDEQYLIYQICFEIYIKYENNMVEGKSYKVHFSKHFVPIVAKIVQLNSFELNDEDIHQIVLSQLASKVYFHNYSYLNQLTYQSNLIVYFKILFKSIYPDQYRICMNFMQNFDSMLSILFMESLASCMDTINFNVYQDFKAAYELIFLIQKNQTNLLAKLKKIEISFASLVDLIFVLNAIAENISQFENLVEPENFIMWIRKVIVKETYELKKNLPKVLETIVFLYNVDFYDSTFLFFKEVSRQQHETNSAAFMNLSANLKKINITTLLINEIVKNEIINNETLKSKAYSLFKIKQENTTGTTQIQDIEGSELTIKPGTAGFIEHDIYFDIAEDFGTNHYKDVNTIHQKSLAKYNSCLIFLNNLDINLADILVSTKDFTTNFNNILEYDTNEFSTFMKQYLRVPDYLRSEFLADLNILFENKNISLIRLLIILICGGFDDRSVASSLLVTLADALTGIYYSNQKSNHFNWTITYIVDQIYSLVPFFYFSDFMNNLVNVSDKNLIVYVKNAKINLTTEVVDVWELCTKHFMNFYHLNGKYGIAFNYEFCKELTTVFNDLISQGQMSIEFHKFELFLELSNKGKSTYHQIAFRITFIPETTIICKDDKPLILDEVVTEDNLIGPQVLTSFYYDSPLCYLTPFSSPRNHLSFMSIPYIFDFKATEVFLRVELNFVENRVDRVCSNIIPWTYPVDNFTKIQTFSGNKLNIKLSYAMFFLKIAELHKLLVIKISENLQGNDVFSFIKLNNEKFQIVTSKNKAVDTQYHLSELQEFDTALKDKAALSLMVSYSKS